MPAIALVQAALRRSSSVHQRQALVVPAAGAHRRVAQEVGEGAVGVVEGAVGVAAAASTPAAASSSVGR